MCVSVCGSREAGRRRAKKRNIEWCIFIGHSAVHLCRCELCIRDLFLLAVAAVQDLVLKLIEVFWNFSDIHCWILGKFWNFLENFSTLKKLYNLKRKIPIKRLAKIIHVGPTELKGEECWLKKNHQWSLSANYNGTFSGINFYETLANSFLHFTFLPILRIACIKIYIMRSYSEWARERWTRGSSLILYSLTHGR